MILFAFGHIAHCTEMRFVSFLSGGFITAIVVNPPERKLAKRTSVQWSTIATCPGKLRTLNLPFKNLILDRYHMTVMLFLIFAGSLHINFTKNLMNQVEL